jgi:hypothetical protein
MTSYPWYTTRERVMSAPDIKASAYATAAIDAACESSSRRVERLCHRIFYPQVAVRYRDWPNDQGARYGRLWLDTDELISLTALESPNGTAIATASVLLEPNGSGPPYTRLELDRSTAAAFSAGSTSQRAIEITGVFGYRNDEESAGTLAGSISSGATTLTGAGARYGVGDLLRIGTERLIVTDRSFATTGQTGTLASSNAAQSLAVSDGTAFVIGEELLIDAERLLVLAIAGNTLTVLRAAGGSTLAAHAAATIFHNRVLTVVRGAVGTTAAAHTAADPVFRWTPPGPVRQLATAYALDMFFQEGAGYARVIGADDNQRQISGRAITNLEESVYGAYARKIRMRAV